jgi:TetR/AcrR family transcriptional repressor of nem operon
VKKCLDAAKDRLSTGADTNALSQFILKVMEGGLMQARTHRNLKAYDASMAGLRDYLKLLEGGA